MSAVTIAGDVLTGDVVEVSDAGFALALSEEEVRAISSREVDRLEVRTCCIDYAWAWATIAGVGVGGGLGALADDEVCSSFLWNRDCEIRGNNFWWGALGGGVVGLVVGMTAFREEWETIRTPDPGGSTIHPLVDFGSSGHRSATLTLGAQIRF